MRLRLELRESLQMLLKIISFLMCHPWRNQKEVFDATTMQSKNNKILWWPPWRASLDHGIHSFEECVLEGSDYFQYTLVRAHTRRRSLTHDKRRGESIWRSSSHHPKKIPQAMRNINNSTLEEPLIHLSIWIRNDVIMNEENDEAEGWRRNLPTK